MPVDARLWLLLRDVGKCCSEEFESASMSSALDDEQSMIDAVEGPSKVVHGSHEKEESASLSSRLRRGALFNGVEGYLTSENPTKEMSSLACIFPSPSQGNNDTTEELVRWTHPKSA